MQGVGSRVLRVWFLYWYLCGLVMALQVVAGQGRVRAGITQMLAPKSAKADVRVYEVRMKDATGASSVVVAEFSWKV
ncbi:hypothetical protein VNO80_06798 [Phaseolus coccineus]|uniref:Uncharacterized protein n=1 Tax=Phaseolus coccineus TaxID=3886 RepID=A0AAN9NID8_PHACN